VNVIKLLVSYAAVLPMIFSQVAFAAPSEEAAATKTEKKTKYVKGKDVNFDSQLVEGQIYRPDLSVVTGDTELGGTGVLRLRKDFADRAVSENGEVKK